MPSSGCQTCARSEEHTSELQSHDNLVCRLLLEKKKLHTRRCRVFRQPARCLERCATRARWLRGGRRVAVRRGGRAGRANQVRWLFFFNEGGPPRIFPFPPPRPFPV